MGVMTSKRTESPSDHASLWSGYVENRQTRRQYLRDRHIQRCSPECRDDNHRLVESELAKTANEMIRYYSRHHTRRAYKLFNIRVRRCQSWCHDTPLNYENDDYLHNGEEISIEFRIKEPSRQNVH